MNRGAAHDESCRRRLSSLALRSGVTAVALMLWFWTQSLIGGRPLPPSGIGDSLHLVTAPVNQFLHAHAFVADALLIVSSALIDLLGMFLLGRCVFGDTCRPFLGLLIVLGLRQLMQALVTLPAPPDGIWRDPGIPALLVTYHVANDYFFSGHTAVAVLGASELARLGQAWLRGLGWLVAIFEIATVLVLRAHYTMDVFTGIITALGAAAIADRLSTPVDRWVNRWGGCRGIPKTLHR